MASSRPRRIIAAALMPVLALAALATAHSSSAQVPTTSVPSTTVPRPNTSPHPEISVSPTSGLDDGDVITVSVGGRFGFTLERTTMQICQAELCAVEPPAPDADALVVRTEDPDAHVRGANYPFRIGVGRFRAADGTTFECGPLSSCSLFVSVEGVGQDDSRSARLTYAGAPTTTVSPSTTPPGPTTTPPTTTTPSTVVPTTRPPSTGPTTVTTVSALCPLRGLVPAWLWDVLVSVLGIAC
jgi:hypothetical protein